MSNTTATLAETEAAAKARPRRRWPTWLYALTAPKIVIGLAIVVFFALLAILGPWFSPYDPSQVSYDQLVGPSWAHWLGTTQTGQDVLSQMLYGARVSMFVGIGTAIVATALSVIIGLTAGYVGGFTDEVLSLVTNVFLVIPSLPLIIIIGSYLPQSGSIGVILIISITSWAWGARILRAQTLSLRRRDFVEAARATGEHTAAIILRDVLPNQIAIIASSFLGTVTGAILVQASFAFLGLSDVTEWSWGTILYWAQVSSALLVGAWWWFVPAGLAIALLGTGLSLINFGIDEFINPRLRAANIGTRKAIKQQLRRPRVQPLPPPAPRPTGAALPENILELRHLRVEYQGEHISTVAVNDVSLTLRRGEVLGIAGESGSGKSTLAYAITRLLKSPAVISEGEMLYTRPDGTQVDVLALTPEELRKFRWEELSIVFQSAMSALNPVLTIGTQIDDTLRAHRPQMSRAQRQARTAELLGIVGIQQDRASSFPHELSGGMRQRAMIAVGLALDPEIIVMDEPTTALDVVMQRQIIEKIVELKDTLGFSVIFITHDLSLLIELSDSIAVMYGGRVVEIAAARDFYRHPRHPYSQGLLGSFPTLTGPKRELTGIPGSPPDLRKLPSGCAFNPRCPKAFGACRNVVPALLPVPSEQDLRTTEAACLLYDPAYAAEGRAPA